MPRVEQVQQKALDEFRQKNINSSKRKKQEKKQQLNEAVIMFICLFFLFSVVFLQLAKNFTPNIDTSVGNNTEETQDDSETKLKVDDRLKLIQFNDSFGAGELQKQKEDSIFNSSLDEPVVIPARKKQQAAEEENSEEEKTIEDKINNIISKNKQTENAETEEEKPADNKPQTSGLQILNPVPIPPSYKVYVGLYKTAEDAQTAKSIIKESTLGQNAFVKLTKEGYTLQIGSYSSKTQAETMVQALRVNNFPLARLAEER